MASSPVSVDPAGLLLHSLLEVEEQLISLSLSMSNLNEY